MKLMGPPDFGHPKQWNLFFRGTTLKPGDFSGWNGQHALFFLSGTRGSTTRTISMALTASIVAREILPVTIGRVMTFTEHWVWQKRQLSAGPCCSRNSSKGSFLRASRSEASLSNSGFLRFSGSSLTSIHPLIQPNKGILRAY